MDAGTPAAAAQETSLSAGATNDGPPMMRVKVQSPQRVFFDENALSISGVNGTGPFDILPHHHNFISLLDACELIIRRPGRGSEQRIKISGGLMHVKADQATVFLDV